MKVREEITTLKSVPKYEENPFRKELLDDFQVQKKRKYITPQGDSAIQNILVSKDDGEIIGESQFYQYKKVDQEKFVKIFTKKLAVMWDMPNAASRVLTYVVSMLQKDSDRFYLNPTKAMKFCKYKSARSIWSGVKWLIENYLIAKSVDTNVYFINPTVMFNGDRVAFVEFEYLTQSNEQESPQRPHLIKRTTKEAIKRIQDKLDQP